jgi:hypothetical protein
MSWPPAPPLEGDWIAPLTVAAAGCVVVSILLLIWGRVLGRWLLAAAAAAAGALCGPLLAAEMSTPALPTRIALAAVAAVLAAVLARAVWAVWISGLASAAAGVTLLSAYTRGAATGPIFPAGASSLEGYLRDWGVYLEEVAVFLWDQDRWVVLAVFAAAVLVPLAICLWRARLGVILATALLGAIGLIAGGSAGLALAVPGWEGPLWSARLYLAVAAAAAAVASLVYQGFAESRSGKEPREAPPRKARRRKAARPADDDRDDDEPDDDD